jgi:predicted nucleic acid-binding protein
MRILLDTNIVIHREAPRIVIEKIGLLFYWFDKLHFTKYIHPITAEEINRLKDEDRRKTFNIKLSSYTILNVPSALHPNVKKICAPLDFNENDSNDTLLVNEVYNDRVDVLITEDKKFKEKARLLNIGDKIFNVEEFLEKVIRENPELLDYKVLPIKQEFFGEVDLNDVFFESLKEDYAGFEKWFNRKSQETAYICRSGEKILGFLYLKVEGEQEAYNEINPVFPRKKRLKVGTFKTALNRYLLGERFVKIIFDNAIINDVDEIYVTIFDKRTEQKWLIKLFEEFGFVLYGKKQNENGDELVYVRDMKKRFASNHPKLTFPFFSRTSRSFIVPIYPDYHTNLFPDSILRTEDPDDFEDNEPFRNAISKVYISRSYRRDLKSGELIVFYRTAAKGHAYYKSVISTVGIVESIVTNIKTVEEFINLCKTRSVFSHKELLEFWDYNKKNRPFVVNFLYAYSFPKRINLKRLIELGVIRDVQSAPRGFEVLPPKSFELILEETKTDERFIVD